MKNKILIFFMIMVLSSCSNFEKNNQDLVTTDHIQIEKIQNTEEPIPSDSESPVENPISTENEPTIDEIIEHKVSSMTLEEKIGQMFIVVPEVFSNSGTVTDFSQLDTQKMKEYNIGGLVLFADNIVNPTQIKELNNSLYNVFDDTKMFISIDEEGGQVARISNNVNFPDKRIENMSDVDDPKRAYEIGYTIGDYLTKYGFNLDFAPVCDTLINSENTVVKKRSFSSDPQVVSEMTENVLSGLRDNGVLTVAKHFPGHGSTTLDTHDGFATSSSTLEEMQKVELLPFINMIENDVDMMMISHVIYPNLSVNEVPATLNYDIITELLKNELGYNGVIITDGMNMGAIANNYSVEDATVQSVMAGIDIILMPLDFYGAYDALLSAVKNGTISEERIDDSVTKILKLKYKAIK